MWVSKILSISSRLSRLLAYHFSYYCIIIDYISVVLIVVCYFSFDISSIWDHSILFEKSSFTIINFFFFIKKKGSSIHWSVLLSFLVPWDRSGLQCIFFLGLTLLHLKGKEKKERKVIERKGREGKRREEKRGKKKNPEEKKKTIHLSISDNQIFVVVHFNVLLTSLTVNTKS